MTANGPEPESGNSSESSPLSAPPRLSGRSGYSALVGFLKFFLPMLAAALFLLIIAWPEIWKSDVAFRIGISDLSKEDARNLTMHEPRFHGMDENDQPYTVTAVKATRPSPEASIIELERPQADITLKDGAWVALSADQGRYDEVDRLVRLNGAVSLFHDSGFELHSSTAWINLEKGITSSREPVVGQGPSGNIEAEGMRVINNGKRIVFTGRSRLVLYASPGS